MGGNQFEISDHSPVARSRKTLRPAPRQWRNDAAEECSETALNGARQMAGFRRQEMRHVVAERSAQMQIPPTRFGRGRDPHMPVSKQVAERDVHCPPDAVDDSVIVHIRDVDGDRVHDDHRPVQCKLSAASSC